MLRRWYFKRTRNDDVAVRIPDEWRALLSSIAAQMGELMDDPDADGVRRLFPPAYADDAERDAGYQILSRDALIDGRLAAAQTVRETARNEHLTWDELECWSRVVADARLVLGTTLDIGEDDEPVDFDDPENAGQQVYYLLGYLLELMIEVMTSALDPDGS